MFITAVITFVFLSTGQTVTLHGTAMEEETIHPVLNSVQYKAKETAVIINATDIKKQIWLHKSKDGLYIHNKFLHFH